MYLDIDFTLYFFNQWFIMSVSFCSEVKSFCNSHKLLCVGSLGDEYIGIVASPLPTPGEYCLHIYTSDKTRTLTRKHINVLMSEAVSTLATIKMLNITKIAGNIDQHPGDTMEHFKAWQADQLKA